MSLVDDPNYLDERRHNKFGKHHSVGTISLRVRRQRLAECQPQRLPDRVRSVSETAKITNQSIYASVFASVEL
jgi:hypothetical protein